MPWNVIVPGHLFFKYFKSGAFELPQEPDIVFCK